MIEMKVLLFLTLFSAATFGYIIGVLTAHEYAIRNKLSFPRAFAKLYGKANAFRILVIVTIALSVACLIIAFALVSAADAEPQYTSYSVQQGDTLWEIAHEKYGDTADIRKAVYDIEKLNGITDCYISPGDIIKLPEKAGR
jgi:nucleoid-associated protein YgaU